MDRTHRYLRLWLVVWFAIAMATQRGPALSEQPAGQHDAIVETLTAEDNGGTISGRVGDQIAIRLKENPTTGYVWTVEPSLRHVTQMATRFTPAENGLLGAGGTRTFVFRLDSPGEVLIRLQLKRDWEGGGSAAEHFSVSLKVRERAGR